MIPDIAMWAWPILLAVATWFSLEFIGKPFLRFQEIRAQVLRTMLRGTLASFMSVTKSESREAAIGASREEATKFKIDMGELAVSLLAFNETEYLASMALRLLGYEIESAASSAFVLSITSLPEGPLPVGAGNERFETMEAILRESLRLTIPAEMAEKLRRDEDRYMERVVAEENALRDVDQDITDHDGHGSD